MGLTGMNALIHTLTSRRITELMNSVVGHYVTIYMIHRPRPFDGAYDGVSPELLEQCIIYAKQSGFDFVSIDDVITNALTMQKPKRPTLCFTLDDGYQDQLDQLVPILLKHDCKPTLFVIADMVDGKDWPWDSKISFAIWNAKKTEIKFMFGNEQFYFDISHPNDRRKIRRQLIRYGKSLPADQLALYCETLLSALEFSNQNDIPSAYKASTWDSLREAEKAGLRIGSHACSHRVFSSLPDDQVIAELERAQTLLSNELRDPSKVFCYPSGTLIDFSMHHTKMVKESNHFIGAVTSMPGNTNHQQIRKNSFLIKRHSFPENIEKFIRYSSWLEYIRSKI